MKKTLNDFRNLLRLYPIFSTLVVTISVGLTSMILNSEVNSFNLLIILLAGFLLGLATAASNVFNQITDLSEDKITKPYRPIPSGIFTVKEAYFISILFYVIPFSIAFLIGFYFWVFTSLFILFTITYSIYPRVKRILILNQLWIGVARGFFLILGAWSIFSYPFEKTPIALSLISCIFVFGGMSSKDIFDAKADKETGVKTLVNVLGVKKVAVFSLVCMVGSVFLVIPFIVFDIFKIYHLGLVLFMIPSFLIFYQMRNVKKYSKFENVSAWVIMHAANFLFVFCFAVLTIVFS